MRKLELDCQTLVAEPLARVEAELSPEPLVIAVIKHVHAQGTRRLVHINILAVALGTSNMRAVRFAKMNAGPRSSRDGLARDRTIDGRAKVHDPSRMGREGQAEYTRDLARRAPNQESAVQGNFKVTRSGW